jgi:hypothetical protein
VFPSKRVERIFAAALAPGDQTELRTTQCASKEITLGAWKAELEREGYAVQLGSWDVLDRWGIRFSRGDGLLGDLFCDLTTVQPERVCANYIFRIQRRGADGTARAWFTPFGIHSDDDPNFYFAADPRFPAGY